METAAAASRSTREARRRRIIERGSDRLALITGQIQSLPPDPERSRSRSPARSSVKIDSAPREDMASGQPMLNNESDREPCQDEEFNHAAECASVNVDKGRNTTSRTAASLDTNKDFSQILSSLPSDNDKGKDITSRAAALLGVDKELSQISSSSRSSAPDKKQEKMHRNLNRTTQISSAIVASQNIRICCSIAAAILVILSYIGFPILGSWSIKNLLMLRPVYLLLLTNISVVVAFAILQTKGAELRTSRGGSVAANLGQALESGLLLQKVIGTLVMDFSVYAVVLICCLPVVQRLGW